MIGFVQLDNPYYLHLSHTPSITDVESLQMISKQVLNTSRLSHQILILNETHSL